MKQTAKMVEFKFPRNAGWKVVWIFNHSSCHSMMPDDARVVLKMNVNPGGKQPVVRDGWWGGKPQQMYFYLGKIPKGIWQILEEESTHMK